jgi:signal transduction histidine kinase
MFDFFSKLFASDFMPHGFCLRWNPGVLWLHILSDGLTAAAYYIIPFALIYLVRKRKDLAFNWMFLLFGTFILACGTTHVLSIVTLWYPVYRFDGLVKAGTALASIPTAFLLIRLLPAAIALPSPENLRSEVIRRTKAEAELRMLNNDLERRVLDRTARLERYNQALQRLAYISSHDLKEPLRNVTALTQLMKQDLKPKLDHDSQELMDMVTEGSIRMQTIIEDMMQYTQVINELNEDVPPYPISLTECLKNAKQNLQVAVLNSGAEIICASSLPCVLGNRLHLQQVFQNLLGNAIKYSRPAEAPRIQISATRNGACCTVTVADNGTGIDMQYSSLIFEAFKRLHGREVPGSGVGLAICKNVIENLGGTIWVTSVEGEGSAFHFTLPLAPE